MKRNSTKRIRPERESKGWKILTLEAWEPTLEFCMKVQRSTGDNGMMSKIRVVTPHEGPYVYRCVVWRFFISFIIVKER